MVMRRAWFRQHYLWHPPLPRQPAQHVAPGRNLRCRCRAAIQRIAARPLVLKSMATDAGGVERLGYVPKGKMVVLGLVSTKVPELESVDDLKRRIDAAGKFVPLDQLALSPQCGFASDVVGNLISEDDQKRKLERVVETARQVWGHG